MSDTIEMDDQVVSEYKIALKSQSWSDLVNSAEPEEFRDSKKVLQIRALKLKGTWVKPFEVAINEYEKEDFRMIGK
jgi:hypothetical protein